MHKKILLSLLLGFSVLISNTGCGKKDDAADAVTTSDNSSISSQPLVADGVDAGQSEKIMGMLASKFPQIKVFKIENSPIPNFYQILAGGDVYYISKDGEFMFVGDAFKLPGQSTASLTEDVRKDSRIAVLNTLSDDDMVVYNPEGNNPDYTVTVFTDIDCGYCRKFHQEMSDYLAKNIKVRYLSFPRAGKGSASYDKARTVWCSSDRNKAMDQAKLGSDFKPASDICDSPAIDKSMQIVRQLGLNGTPALLLEDGTLLPGYMPADALKAALDSNFKKNQALTQNGSAKAG